MIFIWGHRYLFDVVAGGQFQCPLCGVSAQYELQRYRKWFTLFWVPIFPYGKEQKYLRCKRCATTFNPEFFADIHEKQDMPSAEE